ncbi:MAG: PQQ-binding-like beta-propeller repeat protein [Bryobacteraceae bacterium]
MKFASLIFAPVLLCAQSPVTDWPQFRGPNGSGISRDAGTPDEVGPDKNVIWKTALPPGHSSPVLAGSRVFVTAADGEALFTFCLDRATGKILWRREAPRPRKEGFQKTNSPAAPSPAADGDSVFVFFGDFGILAYGKDGNERWRLPLGPFNNQNGHGSSPLVVGDLVVLICDQDTNSYLIAVDKKSGKVRWKVDRAGITRGYATPGVFRPAKGPAQLIVSGSYQLASYALATGEKLWWVNGMAWQVKGVPLIDGDTIYVNTWEAGGDFETPPNVDAWETVAAKYDANKDGKLTPEEAKPIFRRGFNDYDLNKDGVLDAEEWEFYNRLRTATNNLLAIRPTGRGDLTDKVTWRYRKSLPNIPSPLLYGGTLFLVKDGGIVTTIDPKSGAVLKQGRVPGATEQFWSSPVGAAGKVYLLSQGCKLAVLKAEPQWEVLRVNDLDDECFATPALADNSIYLRTRHHLYRFGQK